MAVFNKQALPQWYSLWVVHISAACDVVFLGKGSSDLITMLPKLFFNILRGSWSFQTL